MHELHASILGELTNNVEAWFASCCNMLTYPGSQMLRQAQLAVMSLPHIAVLGSSPILCESSSCEIIKRGSNHGRPNSLPTSGMCRGHLIFCPMRTRLHLRRRQFQNLASRQHGIFAALPGSLSNTKFLAHSVSWVPKEAWSPTFLRFT